MDKPGALLLGVDVGTTHCKAGLFNEYGALLSLSARPTMTRRAADGSAYLDPQELWETVAEVIATTAAAAEGCPLAALGIASMAETGMLVDRVSGAPRSALIPWFDPSAAPQAERLAREDDPLRRFSRAGLRPTFKCSLAKVLWLQGRQPGIARGAVWLSAADWIAFRLSGQMGTDYSLACRTHAFWLDQKAWDAEWLRHFGLPGDLFPTARPAGEPLGSVVASLPGLPAGVPVAVTGHDHVCAAFAAGVVRPGQVFNSMGTAESFLGVLAEHPLGAPEYASGFTYGYHAVPGCFYWMGGISASGGSVEWLRSLLGEQPLAYADLDALLAQAPLDPTGILYFPYLAGSGSPHSDAQVRAAFIGLGAAHGRAELAKAVLEGTAYELEYIRRAAERATGLPIERLRVTGGGTRNRTWVQIKADVSGCRLELLTMPESTLLGAALLAGTGCGIFGDPKEVLRSERLDRMVQTEFETVLPDPERFRQYQSCYDYFMSLQEPLRGYGRAQRQGKTALG